MTTLTAEHVVHALQRGLDTVKGDAARPLRLDDDLVDDLDLDSLDAVDVLSVAETDLPDGVVDAVVDRMTDIRTVGELVAAVLDVTATARS